VPQSTLFIGVTVEGMVRNDAEKPPAETRPSRIKSTAAPTVIPSAAAAVDAARPAI
jgi:hypothetical protein